MIFNAVRKRDPNSLSHYGVKGQKWGVRNEDTLRRYGLLASFGGPNGFLEGMITKDTRLQTKNDEFLKKYPGVFPKKYSDSTPHEDMLAINPYLKAGYIKESVKDKFVRDDSKSGFMKVDSGSDRPFNKVKRDEQFGGSTINCASCSVAFDLRQRGYDVSASMGEKIASNSLINECYPNGRWVDSKDDEEFFKKIYSDCSEPGARGIVTYTGGGDEGHAVAFETDENGKVHFYDCQTGEESTGVPLFAQEFKYMRTDNIEPDLEYIYNSDCTMKTPHSKEDTKPKYSSLEDQMENEFDLYKTSFAKTAKDYKKRKEQRERFTRATNPSASTRLDFYNELIRNSGNR